MGCTSPDDLSSNQYNWSRYLGDAQTNQYAPLSQIDTTNSAQLEVAWTYSCGDADPQDRSQIQCNPLIIDGILYGSSPQLKFFALDAASGKQLWQFDPWPQGYQGFGMGVNRGLTYWSEGGDQRLLVTAGEELLCINASTGQLVNSFGENGRVDLHEGLGNNAQSLFIISNSPGIIFEDLLIIGSRVSESTGAAPGHIRAFNVKTGKLAWIFHTIPKPGEAGYETWPPDAHLKMGGANAWSGFSLDEERGWVFVPTGSAAFDFYGGDREGANLYANCVIALNAKNGEKIWHYQVVHHDLWDRDLPCPPNLVTVNHDGQMIDAVAQNTKSGHVFLLDRETGEPLFPVKEVPVPASNLDGESAWPTQPIPTKPPQFARHRISEDDLTQRTPEANAYAKSIYNNLVEGDNYTPPTEAGTILFPGFDGGGEWGGAAVDPQSGIMYVNASEMPWILQMVPKQSTTDQTLASHGKALYAQHCVMCHGTDLQGASIHTVPSLVNLQSRLDQPTVLKTIQQGKGMMPSFNHLDETKIEAIAAYLLDSKEQLTAEQHDLLATSSEDWPYPYAMNGYKKFYDQDGYPAITPPWGTLNAIDLNAGTILWKIPFGSYPALAAQGMDNTGSQSYGGPIVTRGGILAIAATLDEKFRVFNARNGDLLYEYQLPAAGYATPATYMIDGKQYIVIACGGGKLQTPSGDQYVAFSLPN